LNITDYCTENTTPVRMMQGIVDTKVSKNIIVKATYSIDQRIRNIVRSGWEACRDGYSGVLSGGFDVSLRFRTRLPNRFDSCCDFCRMVVSNTADIIKGHRYCLINQYDSERERLTGQYCNRFDLSIYFRDSRKSLHDRIRFSTGSGLWNGAFDLVAMIPDVRRGRYDAITDFQRATLRGRFSSSRGNLQSKGLCRWDSHRYWTKDRLSGRYDLRMPFRIGLRCRLDAIFSRAEIPGLTADIVFGRYDIKRLLRSQYDGWFDSIVGLQPSVRQAFLYDTFDRAFEITFDSRRCDRQSFVRPGWKIVAKNIVTDELIDIGFIDIDTDNPVLKDVFLPDGDYEISVLTSSLFWNDCQDRQIRLLSLCLDGKFPLPTIYNLRSAVLNGVTTIHWSATQCELGDCVFGVWYDSQSPVDVNRPADATVWYDSSQTEYATTFYQNAPVYVAVAALRTGDEEETGKIHELYLDWSDIPPRRPDEVIILDKPLPVIDTTVEKRHEDDPFLTLWRG